MHIDGRFLRNNSQISSFRWMWCERLKAADNYLLASVIQLVSEVVDMSALSSKPTLQTKRCSVYLVLTASGESTLNPLICVELGRVPSALPPMFTVSCGLSESRNVKSWSETQSDLIPSSLRPSSLNTLRPCAAEVSYLFFLSCRARLHTARTRGSHAFQQWRIMDHRWRRERADCRAGRRDTPSAPLAFSVLFTLQQLASTSLLPLWLLLKIRHTRAQARALHRALWSAPSAVNTQKNRNVQS